MQFSELTEDEQTEQDETNMEQDKETKRKNRTMKCTNFLAQIREICAQKKKNLQNQAKVDAG